MARLGHRESLPLPGVNPVGMPLTDALQEHQFKMFLQSELQNVLQRSMAEYSRLHARPHSPRTGDWKDIQGTQPENFPRMNQAALDQQSRPASHGALDGHAIGSSNQRRPSLLSHPAPDGHSIGSPNPRRPSLLSHPAGEDQRSRRMSAGNGTLAGKFVEIGKFDQPLVGGKRKVSFGGEEAADAPSSRMGSDVLEEVLESLHGSEGEEGAKQMPRPGVSEDTLLTLRQFSSSSAEEPAQESAEEAFSRRGSVASEVWSPEEGPSKSTSLKSNRSLSRSPIPSLSSLATVAEPGGEGAANGLLSPRSKSPDESVKSKSPLTRMAPAFGCDDEDDEPLGRTLSSNSLALHKPSIRHSLPASKVYGAIVPTSPRRGSEPSAGKHRAANDGSESNGFAVPRDIRTTSATGSVTMSSSFASVSTSSKDCPTQIVLLDCWQQSNGRRVSHSLSQGNLSCSLEDFGPDATDEESDLIAEAPSLTSLLGIRRVISIGGRRASNAAQHFMMTPSSRGPLIWELCCLVCICWEVATVPFQTFSPRGHGVTNVVKWLVRVFWTVDMPFALFTCYTDPSGVVVHSISDVARQYLWTRFPFDAVLVTSSWLSWVIEAAVEDDEEGWLAVAGVLRSIQILRLVRLVRVFKTCDQVLKNFSEGTVLVWYLSIGWVFFSMVIHILGCVSYWVFGSNAELSSYSNLADEYLRSVHIVLSLMLSEHVVSPTNSAERIFTIFMLLFGFVICAAIIGCLTTVLSRLQHLTQERAAKFGTLNRFLHENSISGALSARINRNAYYNFAERKKNIQENQVELLGLITEQLTLELHYEMHKTLLCTHPFFFLFDIVHTLTIQNVCSSAISILRISRGDTVFATFEVPNNPAMYIVQTGEFRYIIAGRPTNVREKGIVSEGALWTSWSHYGTMKALVDGQLMSVNSAKFATVMRKVPLPHTQDYGASFVNYLNECQQASDLGPQPEDIREMAASVFHEEDLPQEWDMGRRSSLRRRSSTNSISAALGHLPRRTSLKSSVSEVIASISRSNSLQVPTTARDGSRSPDPPSDPRPSSPSSPTSPASIIEQKEDSGRRGSLGSENSNLAWPAVLK